MLTPSNFSEVSNWLTVSAAGGEVILGISITFHRYSHHYRGARGHMGMHTGRDVDVAINNSAKWVLQAIATTSFMLYE